MDSESRCFGGEKGPLRARFTTVLDDESFKFGALSAGAVMAFDGQTELHLLPSKCPM